LVATGAYGMKTGRGFRQYNEDASRESLERRDNAYKRLRQALGYDD
jgi:3-hydroxyacyl-CoA dehydrogenase